MFYLDPLYGQLEISPLELSLFQTRALTRLRDVSLSAVPPLALASGMAASRFEHSVGVAFLAKKLTEKKEFSKMKNNLYLAALLHDVGSPPFSHLSEPFQMLLINKDHEQFSEEMLADKEMKQKIKKNKADLQVVSQLIKGQLKPWSDLINGTIDLDNLDNTLRWGLGTGVFQSKFYQPEEIVNAFVLNKGKLALKINYQANIQKWELARRLAYELVYSDANLAPASMLLRALQFAYEKKELSKDFFYLTDSQAFYLLENRFNQASQDLTRAVRYWQFYLLGAKLTFEQPTDKVKKVCLSWQEKFKSGDKIARLLKIPRQDICFYAGKDRGFKKIHLPFVGQGKPQSHMPITPLKWRIRVYLHPRHKEKVKKIKEILGQLFVD